jgi:hypothetical protein
MNRILTRGLRRPLLALGAICALFSGQMRARADLVELVNGDQYNGAVVAMSETNLIFRGEIQGMVTLPRAKVARITFRQTLPASELPFASPQPLPGLLKSQATKAASSRLKNASGQPLLDGFGTNLIAQVKQQLLAQAPPEANKKFDDLLGGLMTGAVSVSDIRSQAKDSIKQIQQLKRETPELGDALDSYLEILQSFVAEAEPAPAAKTNAPSGP